jgi:hypothetical protein
MVAMHLFARRMLRLGVSVGGLIVVVATLAAASLAGCSSDPGAAQPVLTRAQLIDPESCRGCHATHLDEWAGSMHAYASDDPVFQAMNRRGQRETNGTLGDFCVRCHAPLALREGLTHDGLNLAQLPAPYKGVNCYFCHSIEAVTGTHDGAVMLGQTLDMLGPIADPTPNTAHRSRQSPFVDSSRTETAAACGSCHDIVNPMGTAIERTFAEWNESAFSRTTIGLGCASCHMNGRSGTAGTGGPATRKVHDHRMAGVDVAITPFPGVEAQRQAITESLGTTVQTAVCLDEVSNRIHVMLDNVGVGHKWPSGAGSDRRVWVEVVASNKGSIIYQSGVVPSGGALDKLDDPDLWLIRDCLFDGSNKEVHMFWQAAQFTTNLLPTTLLPLPGMLPMRLGHQRWELPRPDSGRALPMVPDKINARVFIQPIGQDVLDDLVVSGDLDPQLARATTHEVPNSAVEWSADKVNFVLQERGIQALCVAPPGFGKGTLPATSQRGCPVPMKQF